MQQHMFHTYDYVFATTETAYEQVLVEARLIFNHCMYIHTYIYDD
jgi:hypothetical protein